MSANNMGFFFRRSTPIDGGFNILLLQGFVWVWKLASSLRVLRLVRTQHFCNSSTPALVSWPDYIPVNSHLDYVKLFICMFCIMSIHANHSGTMGQNRERKGIGNRNIIIPRKRVINPSSKLESNNRWNFFSFFFPEKATAATIALSP